MRDFFEKNADSVFFSHNGGQTTMNQNGRVIFFECLRPKLAIFEVKPSIHSLAYVTIARTHSKTIVSKFFQEKKNLQRKLCKFNKK